MTTPDYTKVVECLDVYYESKSHRDILLENEISSLSNEDIMGIFWEEKQAAVPVLEAFYEATKDRNSRNNVMDTALKHIEYMVGYKKD